MSHQAIRSSLPQLRKRRIAKKKLLRRGTPLKEASNEEKCEVPIIPSGELDMFGLVGGAADASSAGTSAMHHHHPPYHLRRKSHNLIITNLKMAAAAAAAAAAATVTASPTTASPACVSAAIAGLPPAATSSTPVLSPTAAITAATAYCPSMLPTRKRPRRMYFPGDTSTGFGCSPAAHYLLYELPDEVLLTIFSYLYERDLCHVAQVCKRFYTIANDNELWKNLYQGLYEYDLPLFNPSPCKFDFVQPEDCDYDNPWKESFKQLYHGVHVREDYHKHGGKEAGRSVAYFETIHAAFVYCDDTERPLVLIHSGVYRSRLVIETNISLIGAAPGNVAENVILEQESESTVLFMEGAQQAYLGYVTIKFSPPSCTDTVQHHKHYALEIQENCAPTIEHCIIRSVSHCESSSSTVSEFKLSCWCMWVYKCDDCGCVTVWV